MIMRPPRLSRGRWRREMDDLTDADFMYRGEDEPRGVVAHLHNRGR